MEGLLHEDGKPFTPHITIAKTSRLIGKRKRGVWVCGVGGWAAGRDKAARGRGVESGGPAFLLHTKGSTSPSARRRFTQLTAHHHLCRAGGGRVRIVEDAYGDMRDIDAGEVTIEELQLCAMQGRRQGEFYPVDASLYLGGAAAGGGEAAGGSSGSGGEAAAAAQGGGAAAIHVDGAQAPPASSEAGAAQLLGGEGRREPLP